jgi:hypothetical protein
MKKVVVILPIFAAILWTQNASVSSTTSAGLWQPPKFPVGTWEAKTMSLRWRARVLFLFPGFCIRVRGLRREKASLHEASA